MKLKRKLEEVEGFCWDGSLDQLGIYDWVIDGIVNREIIIENEDVEIPDVYIMGRKVEKGWYIVSGVLSICAYKEEEFKRFWEEI